MIEDDRILTPAVSFLWHCCIYIFGMILLVAYIRDKELKSRKQQKETENDAQAEVERTEELGKRSREDAFYILLLIVFIVFIGCFLSLLI